MKDLGPLKYFLGIVVVRNSSGMYLSQRKYVIDIITETGLLEAKPVTHPTEKNHTFAKPLVRLYLTLLGTVTLWVD